MLLEGDTQLNPAIRVARWIAVFAGNFLAAMLTTRIFDEEVSHAFRAHTAAGALEREYALSAIIALVLGYFVYYKWQSEPGKWIWVAGVLWFGERVLSTRQAYSSVLAGSPSFLGRRSRDVRASLQDR